MAMQISDIESDLDDISILQTEDGNTSDITINYSSDPSSVGTIMYDHNLHNYFYIVIFYRSIVILILVKKMYFFLD